MLAAQGTFTFRRWIISPRGHPSAIQDDDIVNGVGPLIVRVGENEPSASLSFPNEETGRGAYYQIILEKALAYLFDGNVLQLAEKLVEEPDSAPANASLVVRIGCGLSNQLLAGGGVGFFNEFLRQL